MQLALVARVVSQAEDKRTPAAKAAMDKEWQKLVDKFRWLEKKVREFRDVSAEAKKSGKKAHLGRVCWPSSRSSWKLPCNLCQGIGQALHCLSSNAGLVPHCKDTFNLSTLRMLEQSKLLAATNPASTCRGMHTFTQEAGSKKSQPPPGY